MDKNEISVTHYTRAGDWPSGLKKAAEIAESLGVSEDRLKELTASGYIPHWKIDGGDILYRFSEVKRWVGENLVGRWEGMSLQITMRPCIEYPLAENLPQAISGIPNIREVPIYDGVPGVYFLCSSVGKILYIGQSVAPMARIMSHRADKEFSNAFLLPVPPDSLEAVEGAFIRLFKPVYNGGKNRDRHGADHSRGEPDLDESIVEAYMGKVTDQE